MAERNPFYNDKGYPDPTAYKAIYDNGGHAMQDWQDGDIINIQSADGLPNYKVILKAHEYYATTLPLFTNESRENSYMVIAREMMYAELGKITYTGYRNLNEAEYIRHMSDDEFHNLMNAIVKLLWISDDVDFANPEKTGADFRALQEECSKALQEANSAKVKLAKVVGERDAYKQIALLSIGKVTLPSYPEEYHVVPGMASKMKEEVKKALEGTGKSV